MTLVHTPVPAEAESNIACVWANPLIFAPRSEIFAKVSWFCLLRSVCSVICLSK